MSAWKELQFAKDKYERGEITEEELEQYENAWEIECREDGADDE